MRWLHLTVVIVFAVVILAFVWQNFEFVVVSFLGFHVRTPLAVMIGLAYLLGMATGGKPLGIVETIDSRIKVHGAQVIRPRAHQIRRRASGKGDDTGSSMTIEESMTLAPAWTLFAIALLRRGLAARPGTRFRR